MALYQETGVGSGVLQTEQFPNPERERSSLVVVTDLEGPHLLGDTALSVMSSSVCPKGNHNGMNHGETLYRETFHWYDKNYFKKGLGQEGSDIILAMPVLLHFGVTAEDIRSEAKKSQRIPGSEEYVEFLKEQGGIVIGITTAWEDAHRDIALGDLGFDGIIGTCFPIDEARKRLEDSGRWSEEMYLTGRFLYDSFSVINQMEHTNDDQKEWFRQNLHSIIGQFYTNIMGIAWDNTGKQTIGKTCGTTELSAIMAGCDVVGDMRKAEEARKLFAHHGNNRTINLAIGDGFNDRLMLQQSPWSIGLNGAEAAQAAKIGVITSNVSVLKEVTETIQKFPEPTSENVKDVVMRAQQVLGGRAIVHEGGAGVSPQLAGLHRQMRRKIRGSRIL